MNGKTDLQNLPHALLPRLSQHLTDQMGIFFDPGRWHEIQSKITAAMTDFGFEDLRDFIGWLLSASLTQKQVEILARHLTIGETYFFREKKAFDFLERSVLPPLMETRRKKAKRLRFWSAGSSSGEEAYSLAMVVDKMLPDRKDWDIIIAATDINPLALRKGTLGIYSDWSFRETPSAVKDRYFTKVNGHAYAIHPDIRNMVTFSYLNLAEDIYPSAQNFIGNVDVIFCRNVLMYFSPEHIRRTVDRLYASIAEGGWLIVSPVEMSNVRYAPFEPVRVEDHTFYQKEIRKIKPAQPVIPAHGEEKETATPHTLPKTKHRMPKQPPPLGKAGGMSTPPAPAAMLDRQGASAAAENPLKKDVPDDPTHPDTLMALAQSLANRGNLDEACILCNRALEIDKCNARLHYLSAVIYAEQQKKEEAKNALRNAIYLEPDFVPAHFALGNLFLKLGHSQDARKHFSVAKAILRKYRPEDIIPESDGLTAAGFSEILDAVCYAEAP